MDSRATKAGMDGLTLIRRRTLGQESTKYTGNGSDLRLEKHRAERDEGSSYSVKDQEDKGIKIYPFNIY